LRLARSAAAASRCAAAESDSSGLQFGECRSHMIWRLIKTRISEGSRRVARRRLASASSASSRTPSPNPSRQTTPAARAKRICAATARDSANSVAPRIANTGRQTSRLVNVVSVASVLFAPTSSKPRETPPRRTTVCAYGSPSWLATSHSDCAKRASGECLAHVLALRS
jgi:hypothetical protein